jgi:hypothetical protein
MQLLHQQVKLQPGAFPPLPKVCQAQRCQGAGPAQHTAVPARARLRALWLCMSYLMGGKQLHWAASAAVVQAAPHMPATCSFKTVSSSMGMSIRSWPRGKARAVSGHASPLSALQAGSRRSRVVQVMARSALAARPVCCRQRHHSSKRHLLGL